jgi:glutamate/tyrosine decarboxylase-like PLP-dependent enzyme
MRFFLSPSSVSAAAGGGCPPPSSSPWWKSAAFLGVAKTSSPQQPQIEPLLFSLSSIIILTIFVLSLGTCIGIWIGRRRYYFCTSQDVYSSAANSNCSKNNNGRTEADNDASTSKVQSNNNCNNQVDNEEEEEEEEEEDGPTMVLRGSLDLLASKWGVDRQRRRQTTTYPEIGDKQSLVEQSENNGRNNNNDDGGAVVQYLSPEAMQNLLFAKATHDNAAETLCLDEIILSALRGSSDEPSSSSTSSLLMEKIVLQQHLLPPSPKSSATDITELISSSSDQDTESSGGDDDDNDHEGALDNLSTTSDVVSTNNSTSSSPTSSSSPQQQQLNPQQFIHLLSLIQKYSVNTSHPYFFNQLFGSLDPIALAAEIVALSVNTSVYTYETAPVFTLLEREVMGQIGKLVFGPDEERVVGGENDEDDNEEVVVEEEEREEFQGEGLMIPGGSLANLTAMHAARHRWKVMNGYTTTDARLSDDDYYPSEYYDLVAFVSSEAHYSFSKSARVLGLSEDDLIVIPTNDDGSMNVEVLSKCIDELEYELEEIVKEEEEESFSGKNSVHRRVQQKRRRRRVPFFVACTAGSTVRGSFDEIAKIVSVCRAYESRQQHHQRQQQQQHHPHYERSIWVHVDGAWGGSAIFSSRPQIRSITHMDEIRYADSFTFNPHKMLGAPQQTTAFIVRHRNALREANAAGAKYLFDPRKNGAEYDLGDLSYTCGRRTDAVKLWALWKYYGKSGLGSRVDQKVDELECFVDEIRKRRNVFALACRPWPFNVNFFYFPPRIREILEQRGVFQSIIDDGGGKNDNEDDDEDSYIQIPDDIAQDLAEVSVALKLRLHEAGEMIIPYQPLSNQQADCFRLVVAGKKDLKQSDICHILDTMEKYGEDL